MIYENEINDNDKIFIKATEIKKKYANYSNTIPIIFAKNSKDIVIDSLFFILLFDIQRELGKRLILDITYLTNKSQIYIQIFLTQYIDMNFKDEKTGAKFFKLFTHIDDEYRDALNKGIEENGENNTDRENYYLNNIGSGNDIWLFTSNKLEEYKKIIFDFAREYQFLPIFQLRRLDKLYSLGETKKRGDINNTKEENRRILYSEISLDGISPDNVGDYKKEVRNFIASSLDSLGFGTKNLTLPFSYIFFELIDNIRRHTDKENTNAHMHLSKIGKNFRFIISDNYDIGFLNSYKKTLICEKKKLSQAMIKKIKGKKSKTNKIKKIYEKLKVFTHTIRELQKGEDEKVLKELFDIGKSLHTHQIPRLAMHFGIPFLLKTLSKLRSKDKHPQHHPYLEIYLHRGHKNYSIKYHFDGSMKLAQITESSKVVKNGTYIVITIPEDVIPYESEIPKGSVSLNIKNNDYAKIFKTKHREKIQERISKFPYLDNRDINQEKFTGGIDVNKYDHQVEKDRLITKYTGETFSAYMRDLYLYAYYHDIRDIVVYNVPIEEEKEHLSLMAHIIYNNTEIYDNALNILFYNHTLPNAVFLGGKSKKEFCALAQSLSSYYRMDAAFGLECLGEENLNFDSENFNIRSTEPDSDVSDKEEEEPQFKGSELLYSLDDETSIILPFELFNALGKEIKKSIDPLKKMLQRYLEKTSIKDIHVNTRRGYHIDEYYRFNKIFENSQWVQRIAFRLAIELEKYGEESQIVGMDKYTSLVIAMALHYLERDSIKYIILNDFEGNSIKRLEKFLSSKKKTILISSVLFDGRYIKTKIIDHQNLKLNDCRWISCFEIKEARDQEFKSLFLLENQTAHKLYESSDTYCSVCEEKSPPLYKLGIKDPFQIGNFYLGGHHQIRVKGYCDIPKNKTRANWLNSLYFIHARRGNNHYTYYTKTIDFLRDNRKAIEAYLRQVKESITYKRKVIIFTPVHNTNNKFVALVNKIVFDNNATIKHFERAKGESNFHSFSKNDTRLLDGIEESALYFVDDEISSGYTLEYFYGLLRSIPGIMDRVNVGFDGVIVIVDRMSAVDETIICNYLRDNLSSNLLMKKVEQDNEEKKYTSTLRLSKRLDLFHAFTKLKIRPIKTETEECYLCKQRELYEKLLGKSVLDLTRYQFAHRIVRLNETDSDDIEYNCHFDLQYRIKLWIKKISIEFLANHFDDFEVLHKKYYDIKLVKKNTELVKGYNIILDNFYSVVREETRYQQLFTNEFGIEVQQSDVKKALDIIIQYEAKIALLKAMSFPKFVFYKIIKDIAVTMVYDEIREYRNYQVEHWKKEKTLKPENETTLKIAPLIPSFQIKHEELKKYIDAYSRKTDMDEMNFYYVTAAYLNMHYILDVAAIRLYYQQVRAVKKDRKTYDSALLHAYPFAVKLLVSQDKDKARYFNEALKTFYKQFKQSRDTSLINALYLENNIRINKEDFKGYCKKLVKSGDEIGEKIEKLTKKIKKIWTRNLPKEVSSQIELEHIFINENMNNNYRENYRRYLDSSVLRDVTKNFNKLDNKDYKDIISVYRGTQSKKDNVIEHKQINNSWANDFIKLPKNKDKCYTVVRLVYVDKSSLGDVRNSSLFFLREKTNFEEKGINIKAYNLPILDTNGEMSFKKDDSIKYNIPKVWMKPIGCIVVSHKKDDYKEHLEVSRVLLAIQNEIVGFFREELSGEGFKEAIQSKEYEEIYRTFNHEVAPLFEINSIIDDIVEEYVGEKKNIELKKLENYALYMLELTKVGRIKSYTSFGDIKKIETVYDFFNKGNTKRIISNFYEVKVEYLDDEYGVDLDIDKSCKSFVLPLDSDAYSILFYELIYNASKNMPENNRKIFIYVNDEKLYVENKIGKRNKTGYQIALSNLDYMLNKVGFTLKTDDGDSKKGHFIVEIKEVKGENINN